MAKRQSRAARASVASGVLSETVEKLRDAETYEEAKAAKDGLDFSDIESLAEEMGSWRDNIEANFSATQKFADVSDAADALESVKDTLEGLDELTEPVRENNIEAAHEEANLDPEGDDQDAEPEWKDEATTLADEIENAASELDGVSFPGMY